MNKKCLTFKNCKEERKLFLQKNGFSILECTTCGHRFTEIGEAQNHIKDTYSDDYFLGGKQGYPNYLDEEKLLTQTGLRYAKILSKYTKPGRVLDVGCASGFILKGFEKSGWEGYGLEPNDTMASFGRNELHLTIKTGDLESFETTQKFDVINLIQVIGHITDLDIALKNISQLLVDDGLVLIESWDMESLYAKIMGKYWHEYSPPSVINWFSDKTLNQLFSQYNFELIAKGRPVKKIEIKHGISLVDETTPSFIFKKNILNFFTRTVGKYNVIYPPLDIKWYLFKKIV